MIGRPCRKGNRHDDRIGAGEARPEVAPGIFLVVAAGGIEALMTRVKLQISSSRQSFQRPDGPLTGDVTKVLK